MYVVTVIYHLNDPGWMWGGAELRIVFSSHFQHEYKLALADVFHLLSNFSEAVGPDWEYDGYPTRAGNVMSPDAIHLEHYNPMDNPNDGGCHVTRYRYGG